MRRSMGSGGVCWANAAAETFFAGPHPVFYRRSNVTRSTVCRSDRLRSVCTDTTA